MNKQEKKIEEIYFTNPRDPKDRWLVCRVNKNKKEIEYYPRYPQDQWIPIIKIVGFPKLPAGFAKSGGGLLPKKVAYLLVKGLYEKLNDFDFVVSTKGKTAIRKVGKKRRVLLNYFDFRAAKDKLGDTLDENYTNLKATAEAILINFFPTCFKQAPVSNRLDYKSSQIEKILRKEKLLDNLSKKDIEALAVFFPGFIKRFGKEIKGQKKLVGVLENRNAVEAVYLDELVVKFQNKMKLRAQNEHLWQRFFKDHFLLFNPNYIHVFEKKNLSLSGSFPDFLPVDIYGHLDIFEIKKPNTELMDYDESRKNYYWSKELSKAIAQTENYIYNATTYGPNLIQEIKKHESIDIKVVRPRGFVIAGSRKQLGDDQIKNEHFRLLNDSLKSVRVILYDDVLDNLRAFLKRITR